MDWGYAWDLNASLWCWWLPYRNETKKVNPINFVILKYNCSWLRNIEAAWALNRVRLTWFLKYPWSKPLITEKPVILRLQNGRSSVCLAKILEPSPVWDFIWFDWKESCLQKDVVWWMSTVHLSYLNSHATKASYVFINKPFILCYQTYSASIILLIDQYQEWVYKMSHESLELVFIRRNSWGYCFTGICKVPSWVDNPREHPLVQYKMSQFLWALV